MQDNVQLVAPLRKLTYKAVKVQFTGATLDSTTVLQHLKYFSSHAPVHPLPDAELRDEVLVDATCFSYGAVLLHHRGLRQSIATSLAALSSTT